MSQQGEGQPPNASRERENGWEKEDRSYVQFPWECVVRLRGERAVDAKRYLAKRDGVRCAICNAPVQDALTELEFDHIDGNNRNNARWNLRLSHHICNVASYHSKKPALSVPEREGESLLPQPVGMCSSWIGSRPWSNREGEKHDVMRARWNVWINDMEHGPFEGVGGTVRLRDLAAMAPHALGLGSSNTYRRFIDEDHFGGPLEKFRDDGVLWVRYRGPQRLGIAKKIVWEDE